VVAGEKSARGSLTTLRCRGPTAVRSGARSLAQSSSKPCIKSLIRSGINFTNQTGKGRIVNGANETCADPDRKLDPSGTPQYGSMGLSRYLSKERVTHGRARDGPGLFTWTANVKSRRAQLLSQGAVYYVVP